MMHADLQAAADFLAESDFADDESPTSLSDVLYSWYLNPTPLPAQGGPVLPYELSLPDALRGAHAMSSQFAGGWRAVSVSTWGRVVAEKGEVTRVLERSEYSVPTRRGMRAEPGDPLVVSQCWDWVEDDNGFWYTRRGEWPPPASDRLVRIYWNCPPSSTPIIVGRLTAVLADHPSHAYTIKTLMSLDHLGRADPLVLYLGPAGYADLEDEITIVAEDVRDQLRSATPRMAAVLHPGVGLAEGSRAGDSFGQVRAALIADAYELAVDDDRTGADAIAEKIAHGFEAAGLDPERPYLEPNSARDYV